MSVVRVLLAALLLSALAACNSDDGGSVGSGPAFRNLGKRGDSNLGGEGAAASLR